MLTTRVGVPGVARGLGGRLRVDPGVEGGSEGSIGQPYRRQEEAGRRQPEEKTGKAVSRGAHVSIQT